MTHKIIVVGTSGSGKTTLAKAIAAKLNYKHIELDGLFHHANWEPNPNFIDDLLMEVVSAESWVIDGNYGSKGTRQHVWPIATHIVWLDYPKWLNLWRITHRSIRRALTKQVLWNDNRESLANFLSWSDQSLFKYVWTTHAKRHREYSEYMHDPKFAHLNFTQLKSPRETERWLQEFTQHAKAT